MTEKIEQEAVELLPCPFCGGKADCFYDKHPSEWFTKVYRCSCKVCGLNHPQWEREEKEAIDNWNTRNGLTRSERKI